MVTPYGAKTVHAESNTSLEQTASIQRATVGIADETVPCANGPSIERSLRAPLQARKVRVFTLLLRSVELGGFSLDTALFLVPLLLQTCFFTVPLSGRGFTCSSDDALLSGVIRLCQATAKRHHACG